MIVYHSNKQNFLEDVADRNIEDIILNNIQNILKINVGRNEIESWHNSLNEMYFVMDDQAIPNSTGVAIEYRIPQTNKRIDFLLTGLDENDDEQVVLIELKQWSSASLSDKDGIILTRFQHGLAETSHPSYQVWSYTQLLENFNQTIAEENINLYPCVYLHNYQKDGIVDNEFYDYYINKAPLFFKDDKTKLADFIKEHIKYGDNKNILFRIDNGKIKPSKNLVDNLNSMLKGNDEFIMIDEQKVVFETAMKLATIQNNEKNVLIVAGGPGTGKSVIAVNLLVSLTNQEKNVRYVTKNAAPRHVYSAKLSQDFKKNYVNNMFLGSGAFLNSPDNAFDTLIIDEAHRLNEKSGLFRNQGENQIKEIIKAAKTTIFFIDEDQRVTWNDIGTIDEILYWAKKFQANVYKGKDNEYLELTSQFRCNGSDGYISWLDNTLQIKETANSVFDIKEYDFRVLDSPNELRDLIFEKNKLNNKARMVAGYCWDWVSKASPDLKDIRIPLYNFEMKWNLASDGNLWIIKPESVSEIGCIHTCQGLDLDYIGVIIGPDLIVRDGIIQTNPQKRAKTDASLKGYSRDLLLDREKAEKKAASLIKNTYKTLMSRGLKGCYIYCTDNETQNYFIDKLAP